MGSRKSAQRKSFTDDLDEDEVDMNADEVELDADVDIIEPDSIEDEDEVNASFEDYNNNIDDQIEEVQVWPVVSVSSGGIFETILNLKEWMKQPWSLVNDEL